MNRKEVIDLTNQMMIAGMESTAKLVWRHDLEQRQALARVEAERDAERARGDAAVGDANEAEAQLAEAVGLLKYVKDWFGYGDLPESLSKLDDFLARHAQAEQQEAPQSDPEQSALDRYAVHASGEARLKIESPAAGLQEAQGAQVVEFQREDRYIVIKRKDLESTPTLMTHAFLFALDGLSEHLPKRECLVIESDWPEYEPTWAAIQARVEGRDAQAGDELDAVAEAIFNADKGNWYSVGPYPQLHANDKARLRAMARAALATQPAAGDPVRVVVEPGEELSPSNLVGNRIDRMLTIGTRLYTALPAAAHRDEAVRKDAERYRWLRNQCGERFYVDLICLPGAIVDHRIDAAMRAQGDGEKSDG